MDNPVLADMLSRIIEEACIEPDQARFLRETLVEEMKSRLISINIDVKASEQDNDSDTMERYMLGRLFEEIEKNKLYKFTVSGNNKYNLCMQLGRF